MTIDLRKKEIAPVDDVPWGTHFFYFMKLERTSTIF